MANQEQLKRRLGWLEVGLYFAGAVLIAVFVSIRMDAERLQEEGLEAFDQAVAEQALPQKLPADSPGDYIATQPDQGLWAERRIREYEESLKVAGAPPLAVLSIEALGIRVPVYNGTDEHNLNRGVGRIKGTARIDSDGNLGIAGHRDGFFRPLKDIAPGDRVDLQTASGTVTYKVTAIDIVEPEDVSVLSPTEEKTITLVTCYPFYYVGHAPKRYIVKATAEHILAET